MKPSVLTVSQVNFFIKSLLEGDGRLNDIMVVGEISNFTFHAKSGHLYFSLKDEKAVLKSVMFASSARGLRFRPENGMKVIVRGRVSVYEPSGQYQLYAQEMQPDGIGALSVAYEQLKAKLQQEGLFDPSHKRSLPRYPKKIGVITSSTGAAVWDILQITGRRWPMAEIILCPVLVQGEGAPRELISAVKRLNRARACDVIILGRGGGSLEDLWAFNDEELARTVYASQIPVVSAVGHETDFTICDFVADLRAPTPSAAAELCTPDGTAEMERMASLNRYFHTKAQGTVEYLRQSLDFLLEESSLSNPQQALEGLRQNLDDLSKRFSACQLSRLEKEKGKLSLLYGKLDALSPLKVLSRGYSLVYRQNGGLVRNAGALLPGEEVVIQAAEGTAKARILERGNDDGV